MTKPEALAEARSVICEATKQNPSIDLEDALEALWDAAYAGGKDEGYPDGYTEGYDDGFEKGLEQK